MEAASDSDARQLAAFPSLPGVRVSIPELEASIPHFETHYAVGTLIAGKYRLDQLLAEGGMGSVWRATNLQLDCAVALKVIRAGMDREETRLRLKLEARSAAKLSHPGIVRVFDVDDAETGDPYIVMELLSGETLSQAAFAERLSAPRAVQMLLPIADALSVAHARGIVHRDLKPDNVFIAQEDGGVQPKLLDFGVAKLMDQRIPGLTQSGTLLGTPDYMSPEAARGDGTIDARSDIWAFCVVVYEQVAGQLPFAGQNPYAVLRSIIDDEPVPLPNHAPGTEALWHILKQGLAKDPADRFQSIGELGYALAAWLKAQGVQDDACGLSLDAKWLRPSHSVLTVGAGSADCRTVPPPSGRKRSMASRSAWFMVAALFAIGGSAAWLGRDRAPVEAAPELRAAAHSRAQTTQPLAMVEPRAPLREPEATVVAPRPAAPEVRRSPTASAHPALSGERIVSPGPATTADAPKRIARSATLDLIAPY